MPKSQPQGAGLALGSSRSIVIIATVVVAILSFTASAKAGPGYQLKSSIALSGEFPTGIAIDQSNQSLYVAELSRDFGTLAPGQVEQLSITGVPTAKSPFSTGGEDLFGGVAVNAATHSVYAYQTSGATPLGERGVSKMTLFSSAGAIESSFSPTPSKAQALAADSSGRVIFPNSKAGNVQIFSSTGTLEATVTCASCPGGAFLEPSSVALDSAGSLYVVDRAAGGRVTKFSPSGGSFVYQSVLQSGSKPVAVGVDPSSNDVFVGNGAGSEYHVIAYDSSGLRFDDFALGLLTSTPAPLDGQLAVNATSRNLYLSDPGGSKIWVFERIASIPAPEAAVAPPASVRQLESTLQAQVNGKGHVLSSCRFDYTDHADFLANGYAKAKTAPCPSLVGGTASTLVGATVKGLTPATSYDYRVVIASNGGAAEAGNQSFQTLPALPPEVATGAAAEVRITSAVLNGSVNPRGGAVSNCHFEYVDEAHFVQSGFAAATSSACPSLPSGTEAKPVAVSVGDLATGTGYRFRLVATSNAGTSAAAPSSLTTGAPETCATNPALCPPAPQPPTSTPPTPPTTPPKKPLKCRKGFRKKAIHGKPKCVKIKKKAKRRG
jgi:hypothetical protein